MHLTRGGGERWELLLTPLTSSLFLAIPPPPPQCKCQPLLTGHGAARIGSLGPPPAGPSSRPPHRLHVTVKMQSIPAILITGRCISQQPDHTKEQQTKIIFQHALKPLPPFPLRSASNHWLTGLEKALQVCAISLRFVDVTSRSCFSKYLRHRQFQLPSSGLASYRSYSYLTSYDCHRGSILYTLRTWLRNKV